MTASFGTRVAVCVSIALHLPLLGENKAAGISSGNNRIANVQNRAAESIVFIRVEALTQNGTPDEPCGTGFIVDSNGHILSCSHVVPEVGPKYKSVRIFARIGGLNGREYEAAEEKRDKPHDLVVLKLSGSSSVHPVGALAKAELGQWIVAIGFPKNKDLYPAEGAITQPHDESGWVLTGANINEGMSGGPVFNEQGEVVAVVRAIEKGYNAIYELVPISYAEQGLLKDIHSPLAVVHPSGQTSVPLAASRTTIELLPYGSLTDTKDAERVAAILLQKLLNLVAETQSVSPELSNTLASVKIHTSGTTLPSPADFNTYWNQNSVLQILSGTLFKDRNPQRVKSSVFVGDLRGSLPKNLVDIEFDVVPQAFRPNYDMHAALTLYTLAMNAKATAKPNGVITQLLAGANSLLDGISEQDANVTMLRGAVRHEITSLRTP